MDPGAESEVFLEPRPSSAGGADQDRKVCIPTRERGNEGGANSGISHPGDAEISELLMEDISTSGNNAMLYMAPELKEGHPPSPRSEVYALGVLLFQLVVGDLSRPLDPDWEDAVTDPILREDTAACVDPLPEKRLANPMELSERLRTQNERRGLLVQGSRTALIQAAVPSQRQQPKKWLFYGAALVVILGLLSLFAIHRQKVTRGGMVIPGIGRRNLKRTGK